MLTSLKISIIASQAIPTTSTDHHHFIFRNTKPHQLATGFVPVIQRSTKSRRLSFLSKLSSLKATIFYPEGDDGPTSNDDLLSSQNTALQADQEQLAIKLSHYSNRQTLAHLASAFSPPGHSIPLTHIHQVRCASLDSTHLEIETVVCDDAECASVLVPVPFPVECIRTENAAFFEECVMDNVHSLNREGERKINEREAFSEEPRGGSAQDERQSAIDVSFREKSSVLFPEWWIAPRMEESWECDLLRDALNGEDMRSVRMDLVKRREPVSFAPMDESKVRHDVKVLAIGPAGMMLEVAATDSDEGTREVLSFDTVAIKFSLEGKSSIREEVLRLVSSVSVQ
ncbi:hypothetical protein ACHAW6_005768 [Cyclotella cf. meneghiniana]